MVDMNSMIPKVSTTGILNGILITILVLLVLGAIGYYFYWIIKKKKYNEYKVVIWEADSVGNTHETYDRAGVFLDKKTGHKLLFLERLKKGLNPNKVPSIASKDRKGRLIKTIYLRRIGVSNYVFCHVKIDENGVAFKVGEEDVNWAAQDMERIRRTFNKEGWLQKIAPYIMFIITILIVMIVLISLFNKFEVLKTVSENLKEVSNKQYETTVLLYQLTNETIQKERAMPIITPAGGK